MIVKRPIIRWTISTWQSLDIAPIDNSGLNGKKALGG